jgi:hypothetical protein
MSGLKLRAELAAFPCTASAFSVLAVPPMTSRKLTQQKISAILANQEDFNSPTEAAEFFGVIETMKRLQERVIPSVPINWSDRRVKNALLQIYEQNQNELDPMHRRCWFVRLSVHNFFQGLRPDGSIIATMNYYNDEAAAFTSYELATEVVKRLKQRGVDSRAEVLTAERRQSSITTSLEELGFPAAVAAVAAE